MVAPDLRCHGQTQAEGECDLSAATLAADVVAIWQAMFGSTGCACAAGMSSSSGSPAGAMPPPPPRQQQAQQAQLQQPGRQQQQQHEQVSNGPPATVLVGHSMGGAIAVHAAALGGEQCLRNSDWCSCRVCCCAFSWLGGVSLRERCTQRHWEVSRGGVGLGQGSREAGVLPLRCTRRHWQVSADCQQEGHRGSGFPRV